MGKIFDRIVAFVKNNASAKNDNLDIYSLNYEKKLNNIYSTCDKIIGNLRLLIIADTHGTLNEDKFIEYLKNAGDYDLCIMIGDHYNRDIEIIIRNVNRNKLCGLLGNHDYDYLTDYNIPNLNGRIMEVNGIKILGMEGSFKYKQVSFPSFTQDGSIEFLKSKGKVDILISHDRKYTPEIANRDPAHQGLIGITNYIYENRVPIHIHGHIHENYEKKMLNGTTEISVFGYKLIEVGGNRNVQ